MNVEFKKPQDQNAFDSISSERMFTWMFFLGKRVEGLCNSKRRKRASNKIPKKDPRKIQNHKVQDSKKANRMRKKAFRKIKSNVKKDSKSKSNAKRTLINSKNFLEKEFCKTC